MSSGPVEGRRIHWGERFGSYARACVSAGTERWMREGNGVLHAVLCEPQIKL